MNNMKINIGPYREWVGPYQIAEILCFWANPIVDEYGVKHRPDWVSDFGKFLTETWVLDVCNWVEEKKKRKVKIRMDRYDTWSMDGTLALIIVPMLKQLRETKHGYPAEFCTDDMMYGDQMRFEGEGFEYEEDAGMLEWNKALDEMIWAFEQVNVDWEEQYQSGEIDLHTFEIDMDGMRKHEDRMRKGFENFGKYYQSLWD